MKKIVLISTGLLLVALPLSVLLVMRSQDIRKRAAPATTLSLVPSSLTKSVGDEFTQEVRIDTADNQVIAAEIHIAFDPTKLDVISITNGALFPNILSSGTVGNGVASITVGAANNATPVKGVGIAAVIRFKALAETVSPVSIVFNQQTFVGALAEGSVNVLTGTTPSTVTVTNPLAQAGEQSPTPTLLPTPFLSPTPESTTSASLSPSPSPTPPTSTTPQPTGQASSTLVDITSPAANGAVTTEKPVIKGKAAPGATVTITIYSDPITVTAVADANGNWTYTSTAALPDGPHTIVAAAINPATGLTETATVPFVVAAGEDVEDATTVTPVSGVPDMTALLMIIGIGMVVAGAVFPHLYRKNL